MSVLKKDKGSGYAGRLIGLCEYDELPSSVTALLNIVYGKFKKPAPVPPLDPPETEVVPAGELCRHQFRHCRGRGCVSLRICESVQFHLTQKRCPQSWASQEAEKLLLP